MAKRYPGRRNKVKKNTKSKGFKKAWYKWFLGLVLIGLLFAFGYHYRIALAYYFSFIPKEPIPSATSKVEEARIYQILSKHSKKVAGADVSEYQGHINWEEVRKIEDTFPVGFVFIRATAGKDRVDNKFAFNWAEARKNKIKRGAYHYYRPNENSILQADNFIRTVTLEPGDLPPILDIENLPKVQSMERLKLGLRRWLKRVEDHYGVRPVIYSGESYYKDFLKKDFSEYPFWIANYNFWVEEIHKDWLFWQFTEKAKIKGIPNTVDLNIYNGTPKMLEYFGK